MSISEEERRTWRAVSDTIENNTERAGWLMKDALNLRIDLLQRSAQQGEMYDVLEWYKHLVARYGDNQAWFTAINWDMDSLSMWQTVPGTILYRTMDVQQVAEIAHHPLPVSGF